MVRRKVVEPGEHCPTCNRITKREKEVFFCDQCDMELTDRLDNNEIRTKMFYNDGRNPEPFYFCSWKCLWAWISDNKDMFNDPDMNFFTPPFITEDNQAEFFESVRGLESTAKRDEDD